MKQKQWHKHCDIYIYTLREINISHLGKRKIIFKMPFLGGYISSLEGIYIYICIYLYLEPKWGPFVWPSNTHQRVEDPPPSTSVASQPVQKQGDGGLVQWWVLKNLLMYIIISLYIWDIYIHRCIQLLPYFGILVSVFKFRAVQGVHWNNEIISNPNKDLWGLVFKGRTSAP